MAPSFAQNGGGAFEIARSTRDNFYRNAYVSVESKHIILKVITQWEEFVRVLW